jgi:3',5'-cyclic AMP phosphodiesterase CpdA
MSIKVLHISDLHFGTESETDRKSTRYGESFVSTFINEFKGQNINYLIVSGDIANRSKQMEYDKAKIFLNQVVEGLSIPKEKVLICMGNHDISWDILNEKEYSGILNKDLHKENEKYNNFKEFYNNFYQGEGISPVREFNTNSIFVQIPDDDEKILFLGVNTCHQESNQDEDHHGFIDNNSTNGFEYQLKQLDTKYKDYLKCLVMHHNPMDLASERHKFDNWHEIDKRAIGFPFVVFCGHIHGSDGVSVKSSEDYLIHYISTGSLLKKDTKGMCNLYIFSNSSSELDIEYYDFEDKVIDPTRHYWQPQTGSGYPKHIDLSKNGHEQDTLRDVLDYEHNKRIQKLNQKQNQSKPVHNPSTSIAEPSKNIIDIIKDNQLYYSGHFHWNTDKQFRSHGYIDINYLVSHIDSLEIITRLYKDVIDKIKEETPLNNTLMISIGIECNVIGARLSVLFPESKYSYRPRKREENDHNQIEKDIDIKDYSSIILIKDITFDAEEVIELIEKEYSDKIIHLISLFYCGKKDQKQDIFKDNNNVHFYSLIDDIEIPRCNVLESDCPIIKNKLQTIYRC